MSNVELEAEVARLRTALQSIRSEAAAAASAARLAHGDACEAALHAVGDAAERALGAEQPTLRFHYPPPLQTPRVARRPPPIGQPHPSLQLVRGLTAKNKALRTPRPVALSTRCAAVQTEEPPSCTVRMAKVEVPEEATGGLRQHQRYLPCDFAQTQPRQQGGYVPPRRSPRAPWSAPGSARPRPVPTAVQR